MNYEQAVNYLKSSGMSEEQIAAVVNGIGSDIIDAIIDLLTVLKEKTQNV